ncbi:54S ribosomal protein L36, mitochondrial, partial [Pseudocercospora fuligena]
MLLSPSSRPICRQCSKHLQKSQPVRHATLLKRPKRPYQFTQLITLSDGSTFTHRTSSPAPIYKSTKDTKNHAMWNPSSQKLLNVEEDEAGRLRRFRAKFGRGYDAESMSGEEENYSPKMWNALWIFCSSPRKKSDVRRKYRLQRYHGT